jgi:hypothetical protein
LQQSNQVAAEEAAERSAAVDERENFGRHISGYAFWDDCEKWAVRRVHAATPYYQREKGKGKASLRNKERGR